MPSQVCPSNSRTFIKDLSLDGAFDSNLLALFSFFASHSIQRQPLLVNPMDSSLIIQTVNQKNLSGAKSVPNVGIPIVVGMDVPIVVNNQELNDRSFLETPLYSPSEHFLSGSGHS